jgi:lysophospholipase L1-like esterase
LPKAKKQIELPGLFMKKMRIYLLLLLCTNVLTGAALYVLIDKIGGLRYTWYRYKTNDAGTQMMRADHFGNIESGSKNKPRVVLLGDSQVQNAEWSELLQLDNMDVFNRGISGDHIRGVQARLGGVVPLQPDLLFLWIGVNDLFYGRTPQEVASMYAQLVKEIQTKCTKTELILCTIAPVQASVKNLPMTSEPIHDMNEKLKAIAHENHCKLLDIAALLSDKSGNLRGEFTLDGVHLTHTAYTLIKQQMTPLIEAHYAHGF